MSIHQTLFATYDNPLIVVDSADFDGTNDYMLRGADLSGIANSKKGIVSAWLRLDGGNGAVQRLLSSDLAATIYFSVNRLNTNVFSVTGKNVGGTSILVLLTVATYTAGATWLHLLSSWDLGTAGARSIYMNDVSDLSELTFTDDTLDYTVSNWSIGAFTDGTAQLNGCLAELYFAPGQYLDFSLVANRRKFISASGKPVHLGTTGALPTGTAPLVYQHLDDAEAVANFATNRGTGGNFTITGTLDTGSTSPSD